MRTNQLLAFLVALLFTAVVIVGAFGTSWNTVSELPANPEDQSNIEGIGAACSVCSATSSCMLASLIGAIYMAKGEGN